jgi:hypothetical protein
MKRGVAFDLTTAEERGVTGVNKSSVIFGFRLRASASSHEHIHNNRENT